MDYVGEVISGRAICSSHVFAADSLAPLTARVGTYRRVDRLCRLFLCSATGRAVRISRAHSYRSQRCRDCVGEAVVDSWAATGLYL